MITLNHFIPSLVPRYWKQQIQVLQDSDGVLLIGGTTFSDSMLYKVIWNLLPALPAFLMKKPMIFLSQTIGPTNNLFNKLLAQWTLNQAVEVHARGRQSEKIVHSLGIRNCYYQPDLSFSMREVNFDDLKVRSKAIDRIYQALFNESRIAIGVAPNSIVYYKLRRLGINYTDFLIHVTKTIHSQGFLPILIPHSYRSNVRDYHHNDRGLCIAVSDALPKDVRHIYLDEDLNSAELRSLIGKLHLLIASRFHSMIGALAMGGTPITYGWGHHKYSEVLEEFGVGELYVSYKELNLTNFSEKLQETLRLREVFCERIQKVLPIIRNQSQQLPYQIQNLLIKTQN